MTHFFSFLKFKWPTVHHAILQCWPLRRNKTFSIQYYLTPYIVLASFNLAVALRTSGGTSTASLQCAAIGVGLPSAWAGAGLPELSHVWNIPTTMYGTYLRLHLMDYFFAHVCFTRPRRGATLAHQLPRTPLAPSILFHRTLFQCIDAHIAPKLLGRGRWRAVGGVPVIKDKSSVLNSYSRNGCWADSLGIVLLFCELGFQP